MRHVLIATLSVLIVLAAAAPCAALKENRRRPPDLTVTATGADAGGEAMDVTCNLFLVATPSNLFTGSCEVSVGPDHVIISGLRGSPERALTVVLNGQVTIRGNAEGGTGRFGSAVAEGAAGFPVLLTIDPLARRWAIQSEAPGRAGDPDALGRLSAGDVALAIQ